MGSSVIARRLFALCAGMQVILLASCGGGGGGSSDTTGGDTTGDGSTITFTGGTLSDLEALSPSLTFDNLVITGGLTLPNFSSTTLNVNQLTITDTGSIGYSYGTCDYFDAPNLAINVSGDVVIDGEILLGGRSGTRVTDSSTCNSCYGQDGGDISIVAGGNITTRGRIMNQGGYGSSITYAGMPSSSCSPGASGNLTLDAGVNFNVEGSDIYNKAGTNGDGDYATSGAANVTAGGLFTLTSGSIATTGVLTFQAADTDIWGSITYGSLLESIAGSTDSSYPALAILSPVSGSTLGWHEPLQIQLQSSDTGMGLREVSVVGLGLDAVYSASDFVDGILTVEYSAVDEPMTFDVTATDNKGLQTSASLTGLTLSYPQESEPNDSMAQAQTLEIGGLIKGDIFTGDSGSANTAIQSYLQSGGDSSWSSRLAEDWYVVSVAEGDYLSFKLDFSGNLTPADIDIYLLDSTGTSIVGSSTDDNVGTSVFSEFLFVGPLSAGTYYLALQAYDVTDRNFYTLTLTN